MITFAGFSALLLAVRPALFLAVRPALFALYDIQEDIQEK
jgi:tagatose-1,6-bisphosphate aldolase non-catalytic subunit AgaZ/GatZ